MWSKIFIFEGRILMIKNKFEKERNSINELDTNKVRSDIYDVEMASMYDLPEMTSDITDVTLEEKKKLNNKSVANKGAVSILNDNMASMYDMLKNK